MISTLPQEVLNVIASFVTSDNDCYQCLFVSHTWLKAFRPALYHKVCINNRKQFKQFQNNITNYTKYVKQLHFEDNVGIARDELEMLPSFLPNIEQLHFHPRIWKYQRRHLLLWDRLVELPPLDRFSLAQPLLEHHGDHLRSLTITANLLSEIHADLVQLLFQNTPRLKSLQIIGRDKNSMTPSLLQRHAFSLTDIDNIHGALPELKNITLSQVILSPLTPSEIQTLLVSPQKKDTIESFTLEEGSLADARWLTFIATAYPNIVSLSLDAVWHPQYKQRMRSSDHETVKNGILKIGKDYRQLKHIRVGDVGSVVRAADRLFFDTLYENKMTLTTIDCTVSSAMSSTNKESFDSMMRCTSQHLSTLRVQLWRDIRSIESIVSPLAQCHNLSELELICGKFAYSWNYSCEVDTILDFCPRLNTLKLTTARMTRQKSTINDSSHIHPLLKSLVLKKVHFSTGAFEIIAKRCPNLKELTLNHCVKEKDELDHEILISLPDARLEKLVIDHINLRPSQYFEKCTTDSAMMALDVYDHQDRQRERHMYNPSSNKYSTRWYHLHSQLHGTKHIRSLRRLTPKEALETKLYKMTEEKWEQLEEQVVRGTYRQKQFWKSDIPYGYVHIQCRAVEKLVFNKFIY